MASILRLFSTEHPGKLNADMPGTAYCILQLIWRLYVRNTDNAGAVSGPWQPNERLAKQHHHKAVARAGTNTSQAQSDIVNFGPLADTGHRNFHCKSAANHT
ncbi:hypothetical protein TUM17379_37940 [Shewanella algae]|uniref:Uncharacterized protein n=1 Tax=Shewanella algae TaxID=38313 RepID=A0AAD1KCD8_9GAMM|nr:hypothetical protein TUM17379_37940 [Shewanella algae]